MVNITKPVVLWFQSDLRLNDNPAFQAAIASQQPIIPVFVLDDASPADWKMGGASRWWLHHSLCALNAQLQARGLPLMTCVRGDAFVVLNALVDKVRADKVLWNRRYEPWAMERDARVKDSLKSRGIHAESFAGYLLMEPWEIKNKSGGIYKVFTPFSKSFFEKMASKEITLSGYEISKLEPIETDEVKSLRLLPKTHWYQGLAKAWHVGEAEAFAQLKLFMSDALDKYKVDRDYPALEGVSRLSPYLHFGEISPLRIWYEVMQSDSAHKEPFLRQLIWREFSCYLLYHDHTFPDVPWNKSFSSFPWKQDVAALQTWQRGETGYPIVDAGMRQLWQTGWMHNRVRMIVGSFLVKNLLQPWQDGEKWFWDTLVDADLGNNAAGWQWIAGCGADAAPYFRVFNPVLQSERFDADGAYIRTYVPELKNLAGDYIHAPWQAPPMILQAAGVTLGKNYPYPLVDMTWSRDRALAAYKTYARSEKTDDDTSE